MKKENAFSTHLRCLITAIGVSNDFQSNIASVRGGMGGLKFIDVTQNLKILFGKKCNKIRSSSNVESYYLHIRIKTILRWGCFFLINKLQLRIIYICPDR